MAKRTEAEWEKVSAEMRAYHTAHYHCPKCGRCSDKPNYCPGPDGCAPSDIELAQRANETETTP